MALLVGGVVVVDTTVISALERRAEVGPRRSPGATRAQIRTRFRTESLPLCLPGGAAGAVLGVLVTATCATYQGRPSLVPGLGNPGRRGRYRRHRHLRGPVPDEVRAGLVPAGALATP